MRHFKITKLTNFIIFILCFLGLISCSNSGNNKEFEGIIRYQIWYDLADSLFIKGLLHTSGNNMKYFYKNGNFRKEYFLDDELLRVDIYNSKNNMCYFYGFNKDTILFYTANIKNCDIEFLEIKENENVQDHQCNYAHVKISNDTIPWMNYEIEYWASKSIVINKDRFKNFNDSRWNQIFDTIGSIPLQYRRKNSKVRSIFYLKEINRKQLSDNIFEIDVNKPLREFKLK